jgi:hypothetical protein
MPANNSGHGSTRLNTVFLPVASGLLNNYVGGYTMTDEKDDNTTSGILGLGGTPVPKSPADPTTEYDPESVAQRRARMHEGEREADADADARENLKSDHTGATGIDMGAGGQGTDVSSD